MKATHEITPEMLPNEGEFTDPFFKRFTLRKAETPLKLTEEIEKDYNFPTFYNNVACAIAIFLCSYDNAHTLVSAGLGPKVKPVRMPGGRALVAFSCYEYKTVMNVAPYNEIAMTIPVMVDPGVNVQVVPMVADKWFSRFGYYVFGMPVTSRENQLRGNRIWGLPKVTQDIDIAENDGLCVVTALETDGQPYLKLRIPTTGKSTRFDVTSNLYSSLGGKMLKSETNFKAEFKVNKYMDQLFKSGQTPDRNYIVIGDTPSARVLKDLNIEAHPFQFRYTPDMTSCFDLPDPDFEFDALLPQPHHAHAY